MKWTFAPGEIRGRQQSIDTGRGRSSEGLQGLKTLLQSAPGFNVEKIRTPLRWFDFWRNGYEDPSAQKAQQYERWRKLRKLHEMDLRQSAAAEPDGKSQ